jgi:hypothetical protein
MAAAKAMLDETHCPVRHQPTTDHKHLQRGHHNIAIACLPSGAYGTISAATVLSHMLQSFPNLRFCLKVGIGGGVPRENVDIRRGDVVVSMPSIISGGVVQYDYGKTLMGPSNSLVRSTSHLRRFLLTALS